MCYSSKASLFAFIINLVGSIVLFFYHPPLAIFFAFVGTMQLFDYIFWTYYGENRVNYNATKSAMIFNHLQPFVLALVIGINKKKLSKASIVLLLVYCVAVIPYTISTWNRISYTVVRPSSFPSLKWEWNVQPGSILTYILFFLSLITTSIFDIRYPINLVVAFVMTFSLLISIVSHKKSPGSMGRFWCHYGAYTPLFLAFIIKISKTK